MQELPCVQLLKFFCRTLAHVHKSRQLSLTIFNTQFKTFPTIFFKLSEFQTNKKETTKIFITILLIRSKLLQLKRCV